MLADQSRSYSSRTKSNLSNIYFFIWRRNLKWYEFMSIVQLYISNLIEIEDHKKNVYLLVLVYRWTNYCFSLKQALALITFIRKQCILILKIAWEEAKQSDKLYFNMFKWLLFYSVYVFIGIVWLSWLKTRQEWHMNTIL